MLKLRILSILLDDLLLVGSNTIIENIGAGILQRLEADVIQSLTEILDVFFSQKGRKLNIMNLKRTEYIGLRNWLVANSIIESKKTIRVFCERDILSGL